MILYYVGSDYSEQVTASVDAGSVVYVVYIVIQNKMELNIILINLLISSNCYY
jgi:hypothetical protein